MKKPTLLLFSDCFTFGGSEYVVVNILRSSYIKSQYELHFAYREHKEYSYFVDKILGNVSDIYLHPLKIWSNGTLFHKINLRVSNKYIRYGLKLPMWLIAHSGLYEWNNKRVFKNFLRYQLHSVDLVHINNGGYPASESCLYFAICAKSLGIKNLMQINNGALPAKINKRDLRVGNSVSLFVTATEFARKELAANRHFDINKITTLFNAVETPTPCKNRSDVLQELSINPSCFVITEVALLEKRKGQIPFLKALLRLKEINIKLYEKIVVVFVGNGEDEDLIKNFVKDNNLNNQVKLLGYRLDYIDIINASDVYALPSLFDEDMPLSILSAMALSKPILSTKLAGIPEEVEDGINGYLADPNSLTYNTDMACLIDKIYNNRDKLGKASLERYNKLFSRDIYEKKLLGIYSDLIQSKNDGE